MQTVSYRSLSKHGAHGIASFSMAQEVRAA